MAETPKISRIVTPNTWDSLRRFTDARIALGRAGTSMPTQPHLDFQLAHSLARDAVHSELEVKPFMQALEDKGYKTLTLQSASSDRMQYLQRPDLGRTLSTAATDKLRAQSSNNDRSPDIVFVIADGLSASAVHEHAIGVLDEVFPKLSHLEVAPIILAQQARVALGDEIGEALGARLSVVLIGERPGLSSPDSLGAYLTYEPRRGRTDAERNCISNIRQRGLSYGVAAQKLLFLIHESLRRKLSGVDLKENADSALPDIDRTGGA